MSRIPRLEDVLSGAAGNEVYSLHRRVQHQLARQLSSSLPHFTKLSRP